LALAQILPYGDELRERERERERELGVGFANRF